MNNKRTKECGKLMQLNEFPPEDTFSNEAGKDSYHASIEQLLKDLVRISDVLEPSESLLMATKLIQNAAYSLVLDIPAQGIVPLLKIAADLEREAERVAARP